MVLEPPKPRRKPMAPPPPKLEEALRQKLAEAVGDDATSYQLVSTMRPMWQSLRRHEVCRGRSTRPTCGGTGGPRFPFLPTNLCMHVACVGAEFKEVVDAKNGVISSSEVSWVTWCVFAGLLQQQPEK